MFDVFSNKYSFDIFKQRYALSPDEKWKELSQRVTEAVCGQYLNTEDKEVIYDIINDRKFLPAGRYLYASGRSTHMVKNCYAFKPEDTRESWADLMHDVTLTSMLGGGCGTDYSNLRGKGEIIKKTGGVSSGVMALVSMINESARYIRQGGTRRAALFAGLRWDHKDIWDFIKAKDWSEQLKICKDLDPEFPLPLELTNLSVSYNTDFFVAISDAKHPNHSHAKKIWEQNCLQAFKTGEPGFCFDHLKDSESLRNPCGEFVTETSGDSCNLGTVFINRCDDRDDFEKCVKYATKFLICGNIYSDYPSTDQKEIAQKNNRIGLGLGGLHNWLIERDSGYAVTTELHKWLNIYERASDESAYLTAKELDVIIPKSKRAIAPTGTISAIAESSSGIEPIFCKAYKRKYSVGEKWKYQYVIDPMIKRYLDEKKDISKITDAYEISFKDRIKFQADVQQYVDMAISSTCNLPQWGSEGNNETTLVDYSRHLLRYAKRLRGFTAYPSGARAGQPLERCTVDEAMKEEGKAFDYKTDNCSTGVCGI